MRTRITLVTLGSLGGALLAALSCATPAVASPRGGHGGHRGHGSGHTFSGHSGRGHHANHHGGYVHAFGGLRGNLHTSSTHGAGAHGAARYQRTAYSGAATHLQPDFAPHSSYGPQPSCGAGYDGLHAPACGLSAPYPGYGDAGQCAPALGGFPRYRSSYAGSYARSYARSYAPSYAGAPSAPTRVVLLSPDGNQEIMAGAVPAAVSVARTLGPAPLPAPSVPDGMRVHLPLVSTSEAPEALPLEPAPR